MKMNLRKMIEDESKENVKQNNAITYLGLSKASRIYSAIVIGPPDFILIDSWLTKPLVSDVAHEVVFFVCV